MVVLLIHPAAQAKHQRHIKGHQQMEPKGGYSGLNDDLSEVADKKVHRVQKEGILNQRAIAVNGVENGRHIHQQLGEYAPKILNVPEEHIQRRQDQPHADIKTNQKADGIEQQKPPPGKSYSVQNAKQHEHAQSQPEVNEALNILGKQEQILGHIHLGEDAGIIQQAGHALACGFIEESEDQVAAKQVNGVMLHVPTKELSKNKFHHQQHEQRRQHTPSHPQHRALIFLFEVSLHQFLKEELVATQSLYHCISLSIEMVSSIADPDEHLGIQPN